MATNPRPTRYDEAILLAAAKTILPEITNWLKESNDYFEGEDEQLIKDIAAAAEHENDAYQIAKNLDAEGWLPNAELVDILDGFFYAQSTCLEKTEEKWALDNNLQPIPLETKVICKDNKPYKDMVGVVVKNHKNGKATVCFEQLGHIREEGKIGIHGSIIAWENLIMQNEQEKTEEK